MQPQRNHGDEDNRDEHQLSRASRLFKPWRPRHFSGDIFKFISLNESCCILITISLNIIPKDKPPLDKEWVGA